jgi:CBS domain-containing protein
MPRRGSVAPGVDLLDLGGDEAQPGVILCLAEESMSGRLARATWVTWGLARPSVNLFLGPLLGRVSPAILESESDTELEAAILKAFSDIKIKTNVRVEQVLTPLSYRIYPETPITEIQNLMLRRGVSAVPVVGSSHELLGVVTAGDVLPHILPGRESGNSAGRDVPVARQIMTRSVLCVSDDESLLVASRSMIARGVPRLPVVRDGELIGFLERGTVMRAFAESIVTSPS